MKYLIIFIFSLVFATDLDFDGINDNKDYCPRTPLLSIVDKNGCAINKKLPFNFDIEIGEDYIFPSKIPQQYLKTKLFHKSYEATFYISRVKIYNSFHTYNRTFSISKKFYNLIGYYKLSLFYYSSTYYNNLPDKAIQFSVYSAKNDILFYYKFKKISENNQYNKHTIFIEKFIKHPKVIIIPFFYMENSSYDKKINKYLGSVAIVRFRNIYTKFTIAKPLKKGVIFSIAIGKSF